MSYFFKIAQSFHYSIFIQFQLIKCNPTSLSLRRCLIKLGLKTVIVFSELLFLQIAPHATARFLFLSSLYLLSILVSSTKHLPQNILGLCQLEVKLLPYLIQLKVTRYGWLLTQSKITKNIHWIHLLWMRCYRKYSQPGNLDSLTWGEWSFQNLTLALLTQDSCCQEATNLFTQCHWPSSLANSLLSRVHLLVHNLKLCFEVFLKSCTQRWIS